MENLTPTKSSITESSEQLTNLSQKPQNPPSIPPINFKEVIGTSLKSRSSSGLRIARDIIDFRPKKIPQTSSIPKLTIPTQGLEEHDIIGDTPQDRLIKTLQKTDECYAQFKEILTKKGKKPSINEKEALKLMGGFGDFCSQMTQCFALLGISPPQVHLPDSDKIFINKNHIDFFAAHILPKYPQPLLDKINMILHEKVVLDLSHDLYHGKNKQIIRSFIAKNYSKELIDKLQIAIRKNNRQEISQAIFTLLWEYKEAVYQSIYINRTHSVLKEINALIDDYKKNHPKIIYLSYLKDQIPILVESMYLLIHLRSALLERARSLIMETKEIKQKSYKAFRKAVYKNFKSEKMSSPLGDWTRAAAGGWITLFDNNGHRIFDPFETKPSESEESNNQRLDQWVQGITQEISFRLFGDRTLLTECFEILQTIARGKFEHDDVTLKDHETIFSKLITCDEETFERIFLEVNETLKINKPGCSWNAQTIIQYIMLFYRAPSQTLVWGATGALRTLFLIIFPESSTSMKVTNHWESDQAQQIHIKFNDTEIQFTFIKRGNIIDDNTFWLQKLQILIPIPGGKELKHPVTANFYYSYPESDQPSDAIIDVIKKLSFVIRTWRFPVLLRDITKETSLKSLARDALSKLKFLFTEYSHPIGHEIQLGTINWLKKICILFKEQQIKKIDDSEFGYFIVNGYPGTAPKVLSIFADFATFFFLYDDGVKLMINPREVKQSHEELLAILTKNNDPSENEEESYEELSTLEETTDTSNASLMLGVSDLNQRINQILIELTKVDKKWKQRFLQDIRDYCLATIRESENKHDNVIPSVGEYFQKRPHTGATYLMFDFIEIAKNITIPQEIFEHPSFVLLRLTAVNLVNWENDIHSAEKEIGENDVHNLIVIFQHQFGLSYQEAFDYAVQLYNHGVKRFEECKYTILHDDAIKKNRSEVQNYIEGLTSLISAHHFWAKMSGQYHKSLPQEEHLFHKEIKKLKISIASFEEIQQWIENYQRDVNDISLINDSKALTKIGFHIKMIFQKWIESISKMVTHDPQIHPLIESLKTRKRALTEENIAVDCSKQLLEIIFHVVNLSLSGAEHAIPWGLVVLLKQINSQLFTVFSLTESEKRVSEKITFSFFLFKILQPQIFKDFVLRNPHADLYMLDGVFRKMVAIYEKQELPKELTQLYGT